MSSPNFKQHRALLVDRFHSHFMAGGSFATITQARKLASEVIGEPVVPGKPLARAVEEAIEQGVLLAAKSIVARGEQAEATYSALVDLYQRQPTLGTRTSSSIEKQQYSTPVPLAYLAGQLAGLSPAKTVYEPTAGHGALLLLSGPAKAIVNELDPDRAADLRAQGYSTTEHDATVYRPAEPVDIVIANPPFGRRRGTDGSDKFNIGAADTPITTAEIDQAIAWKSLEAMKADGKAVLIIGSEFGNSEQRLSKYNTARSRKFFFNLYRQYHIADHFTVDGSLYSRQGAGFPVDIIVVEGRKERPFLAPDREKRRLPGADPPRVYTSYAALKAVLPAQHYEQSSTPALHSKSPGLDAGRRRERGPADRAGVADNNSYSRLGALPDAARTPPLVDGQPVQQSPGLAGDDQKSVRESSQHRNWPTAGEFFGHRSHSRPDREPADGLESQSGSQLSSTGDFRASGEDVGNRSSRQLEFRGMADPIHRSQPVAFHPPIPMPTELTPATAPEDQTSDQVLYKPRSSGKSLGSYVPQNLESPIQNALSKLEAKVGNIDEFVADAANFGSVDRLHKALAAEQIDGIALAIQSLQQGKAALIGDDTGLGKGRQMATAIKYAIETGRTPVFLTKDPGLYADMVRDLYDIGMRDIRPFMTNSSQEIPLPDGRSLKTSANSHQQELAAMLRAGELSAKYNMVFSTYSQIQTVKGRETDRRCFLEAIAPDSLLILDEAHEGGGSNQQKAAGAAPDRAQFLRQMVAAADGVFFSSATATKRPDVMDLYAARMNIAEVTSVVGLQATLEDGGTPLQQVATAMMAEDGQYIRRERTFAGVDVGSVVVPTNHADADQLSSIMRAVVVFDNAKKVAVHNLNKEARSFAKGVGGDNSIGEAGAKSTNFTSIMWNVVAQTALARKADAVADLAISAIQSGERPFIGLSNTMGSFIEKYARETDLRPGDPVDVTFQDVLFRYLERSRDITIRGYSGSILERRPMADEELGPQAVELYESAAKLIDQANFENMPLSPIDWIQHRIESAGYSFGELTGRTAQLKYDAEGNATYQTRSAQDSSKAAKIAIIKGFNDGTVDVGLGNRSASTGYSMHSSEKFPNQQRRHFIIAQPEGDINVFKQFLGRFHRTGQVNAPKISLVAGDTPDEKRPAAVLGKKLGTLKANTTAARKGGIDFDDIPDYLNAVGDRVVSDMLRYDPDLCEKLQNPIAVSEASTKPVEGAVAKVTGFLPILPVKEQEEFYAQLDMEYQSTIERYRAMGEDPLEATGVDLDARTLASVEVLPREVGIDSAFSEGIIAQVVDVKTQSKPKTQLEVVNDIRQALDMLPVRSVEEHNQGEADIAASALVNRLYAQTLEVAERYKAEKKLQYAQEEPDPDKRLGKIDRLENRVKKQLETLTQIKRYKPGQSVRMTASNGRVFYGVISEVRKRGKSLEALSAPSVAVKENVAIPSRWDVVIALADAERQISLPLSKMNPSNETSDSFTVSRAQHSSVGEEIYGLFDQRQTGEREVRTLLKGNLLRVTDTPYRGHGKLILASMSSGQREPVMLMDKGFNPQQEMETAPVILPRAEVVREFIEATKGAGIIKTTNEAITIKTNRAGELVIQTGKTRKDIYLDPQMLGAINGEFTSVSDRMEAAIHPGQLEDVMSYLYRGRGMKLAAFTEQATARDLLDIQIPELKWADTVESVLGREGLPPAVDMKNLEGMRDRLAETFEAAAATAQNGIEPPAVSPPAEQSEADRPIVENGRARIPETSPADVLLEPAPPAVAGKAEVPAIKIPRSKHPRLAAERQVAQFLTEAGLAQKVMTHDSFHTKIENDPYMPLVVEAHKVGSGNRELYLTHYFEQNGDLIHDGEMVFKISQDGQLILDQTAVQNGLMGGEMRGYDRKFAEMFSKNILEQGFAVAALKQQAVVQIPVVEADRVSQEPEAVGGEAIQAFQPVRESASQESLASAPIAPLEGSFCSQSPATAAPALVEGTNLEAKSEAAHHLAQSSIVCKDEEGRDRTVAMPRAKVQTALAAAQYIDSLDMVARLQTELQRREDPQQVFVSEYLSRRIAHNLAAAREKQQHAFAADILPAARKLLETAAQAGLAKVNGNVTSFMGNQYGVKAWSSGEKEEIKVYCRKGAGMIHAVNGAPHEVRGLLKRDRETFTQYANKSAAQLRSAVSRRRSVSSGIAQ